MPLTIQDLKVDQTYLSSESSGILVSNINIPESEFDNLDNVLERVRQFISTDYVNVVNIQFQVCATYLLKNSETGEQRQWSGSFNPRGNQLNSLSPFQTFAPNFKTIVKNACATDNVYRHLRFYHVQTNWVFEKLSSIIISVQAVVNTSHSTLIRRNLTSRRYGRSIQTFLLP